MITQNIYNKIKDLQGLNTPTEIICDICSVPPEVVEKILDISYAEECDVDEAYNNTAHNRCNKCGAVVNGDGIPDSCLGDCDTENTLVDPYEFLDGDTGELKPLDFSD